jgi:hypothetical protein
MTIYCTYLTVYTGNKLPPFYIGSTSIEKINRGYKGSVSSFQYRSLWKQEIQKSPHLFKTTVLTTHTTRKEALDRELKFQKHLKVVQSPLYVNVAYAQPNGCCSVSTKGATKSTTTRRKMMGNKNAVGNHKPKSETHKLKISTALKGKIKSESSKHLQSVSMKGRSWWTSFTGETKLSFDSPGEGWTKGRHSSSSYSASSKISPEHTGQ